MLKFFFCSVISLQSQPCLLISFPNVLRWTYSTCTTSPHSDSDVFNALDKKSSSNSPNQKMALARTARTRRIVDEVNITLKEGTHAVQESK